VTPRKTPERGAARIGLLSLFFVVRRAANLERQMPSDYLFGDTELRSAIDSC
jgi:hypothetical protein